MISGGVRIPNVSDHKINIKFVPKQYFDCFDR